MEYKGVPKGNPFWALVIGFTVAVAALMFGLWLVRPRELAKLMHRAPAAPAVVEAPMPPPPPPLPAFVME